MEKVKRAQEISDIENSDIEKKHKRIRRDKIKEDNSSSSDEQENMKQINNVTILPPSLPSSFIVNGSESSRESSKILKSKSSRSSVDSLIINKSAFDNSHSD